MCRLDVCFSSVFVIFCCCFWAALLYSNNVAQLHIVVNFNNAIRLFPLQIVAMLACRFYPMN